MCVLAASVSAGGKNSYCNKRRVGWSRMEMSGETAIGSGLLISLVTLMPHTGINADEIINGPRAGDTATNTSISPHSPGRRFRWQSWSLSLALRLLEA